MDYMAPLQMVQRSCAPNHTRLYIIHGFLQKASCFCKAFYVFLPIQNPPQRLKIQHFGGSSHLVSKLSGYPFKPLVLVLTGRPFQPSYSSFRQFFCNFHIPGVTFILCEFDSDFLCYQVIVLFRSIFYLFSKYYITLTWY